MASEVWSTAILDILKAPKTPANYRFLNQWLLREHAHGDLFGNQYGNNPFFTTAGAGGTVGPIRAGTYPRVPASVSPGANHAGVAMYPTLEIGVIANAYHIATEYPAIDAAIRSGNPGASATNPEFQRELATWSGGGYDSFQAIDAPAGPVGASVDMTQLGKDFVKILAGQKPITHGDPGASGQIAAGAQHIPGVKQVEDIGSFLGRISSASFLLRAMQVVAGGGLVLVGVVLLVRQVGLAPDAPNVVPAPVAGAAAAVE